MGDNENRKDGGEYEEFCMMCRRPESLAGKMLHLPGNIHVCSHCMDTMTKVIDENYGDILNGAMKNPLGFMSITPMNQPTDTSFLDKEESGGSEKEAGVTDLAATEVETPPEAPDQETVTQDTVKKAIPRFSFINLADMSGDFGFPGRSKVKKRSKGERKPLLPLEEIPAPHKIKAMLDEYVVGQEHAKKVMSVAVYNHYKRVATGAAKDIEIEKSNMLMIGPTGCGKTYLVKTLARLLDVPLAITDATSLTEAGYIGDDIESVVSKLLAAADNDIDKAEQGIIFIDEIDKIAKKKETHSRDVSGESVQQGMLKLLEGADIEVPIGASSKNAMVPTTTINTSNILFICGGAFPGLEEIIEDRINKQTSIGFNAELKGKFNKDRNILSKVTTEDIRKYGMIPEFVGRLPMIYTLEGLDKDMLVQILKEPKNAILKQYQKLLELDEVKLCFEEDALETIAEKAMERETGARALRSIIDEFMLDIMYEIPKDDNIGCVTITKAYIEGKGAPLIELRGSVK